MTPTTTDIEERDKWRARINRALAEFQTHADHIERAAADERKTESSAADA
ncbi:MAG: hypothetical protein KIT84_21840 [Labilithrix sp.]|nr:hypothetical protein [Labilithrix sp.]MCW5813686.1 hypothetical protein [Labilithrix sp.]